MRLFDDEVNLPQRKDIFFIPHFFNHQWAIDQNHLLSQVFTALPFKEDSYMSGKSGLLEYCATAMPYLRKHELKSVYYENILEDFEMQILRATPVKNIYGMQHESARVPTVANQTPLANRMIPFEDIVGSVSKRIFASTHFYADLLPYPTTVIGQPIFSDMREPQTNNNILFSHRWTKVKGGYKLLTLPKSMQKNIVVSVPFMPQPSDYYKVFYEVESKLTVHRNTSKDNHKRLLETCGFGLTFSTCDMFGISVVEHIFNGAFYFCYDNDGVPFNEFMMPEFLFKTDEELIEKYHYYCGHTKERVALVREQQKRLDKYQWKNWLTTLLENIE